MKNFLVISIPLTLLASMMITGVAQTRDEFRQKYGPPNSKGQYAVKSNIGVKVEYTQDRIPSRMFIEPLYQDGEQVSNSETEGTNKVMSSVEAERVLDELVPVTNRGKEIGSRH